MPKIKTVTPVYINANQVEKQFGVTHARLLTLVATENVRVHHEVGFMPKYNVEDLRAHLRRDPTYLSPYGTRAVPKANPGPRQRCKREA